MAFDVTGHPGKADFVRVRDYLPRIDQQLPYATAENFTGRRIYGFTEAYLRYGTVEKLARVCGELEKRGLRLKLWDGFRPVRAQFRLWEVLPDPDYVANPNKGFSAHSRGNTVDVTLVDEQGREIPMPSAFDDFTGKASRDYRDADPTAAANALLLQNAMEKQGFVGLFEEWWHFRDEDTYPVEELFQPVEERPCRLREETALLAAPAPDAPEVGRIPQGGEGAQFGVCGDFALVEYRGRRGYVPEKAIDFHS